MERMLQRMVVCTEGMQKRRGGEIGRWGKGKHGEGNLEIEL